MWEWGDTHSDRSSCLWCLRCTRLWTPEAIQKLLGVTLLSRQELCWLLPLDILWAPRQLPASVSLQGDSQEQRLPRLTVDSKAGDGCHEGLRNLPQTQH